MMNDGVLQTRDRIRLVEHGPIYRVLHVNACRAHVQREGGQAVTIGDHTFTASGRTLDVSPQSFVEIVSRDRRIKKG